MILKTGAYCRFLPWDRYSHCDLHWIHGANVLVIVANANYTYHPTDDQQIHAEFNLTQDRAQSFHHTDRYDTIVLRIDHNTTKLYDGLRSYIQDYPSLQRYLNNAGIQLLPTPLAPARVS